MVTAVGIANLLINAWLLIILHRQNVRKRLLWFASYIAWVFASGLFQLGFWLINRQQLPALYWSLEAVEIVLIVGSARESFLRIFGGFTSIKSFRWLVTAAIAVVVAYSAWKVVYAPPIHAGRLAAFVDGAEHLFRWGVSTVALIRVAIGLFDSEPMDSREDAVLMGLGLASLCFVLYLNSFSPFPKQYIFLFQYLPSVGYFVAAFWWIFIFSRPVREIGLQEVKESGLGREAP